MICFMIAITPQNPFLSLLQRLAVFAAVAVIALIAFAQFVRRTSMFYPERFPFGVWDTSRLAMQPQDVTFTTSDGVRLHAWLFRGGGPLLIWLHGNGGNLTHRADLAARLATMGLSVLVVDWRGYGKSEGMPYEAKLYRDALAAYDYAARELGAREIAMYGESLGGPYAAYVASKRKVTCVVIENSFPSLRELGNTLYYPVPLGWTAPFAMATTRWLNEGGAPVLVMHGRHDEMIPFELAMRLYNGLNVPKELFVSETARHSGIPDAEGQRYFAKVAEFVKKGSGLGARGSGHSGDVALSPKP